MMIAKPARNACPECNKDQQHTKGVRDCVACRGEGFVLSKMEYPPKGKDSVAHQWESEEERREWFARNKSKRRGVGNIIVNSQVDSVQGVGVNEGVVNMGKLNGKIQRPETTLEHFSYAMDVMHAKVGNLYDYNAKFWISENVHTALFLEFDNIKIGIPYTLFGIPVKVASHMKGMECSLSGRGSKNFSFTIPKMGTVEAIPERTKPKRTHWSERQPSLTTYGKLDPLFSIPNWITRLIDWLNRLAGAEKPKRKNGEQMASIDDLFEGYEGYEAGVDWGDGEDKTVLTIAEAKVVLLK